MHATKTYLITKILHYKTNPTIIPGYNFTLNQHPDQKEPDCRVNKYRYSNPIPTISSLFIFIFIFVSSFVLLVFLSEIILPGVCCNMRPQSIMPLLFLSVLVFWAEQGFTKIFRPTSLCGLTAVDVRLLLHCLAEESFLCSWQLILQPKI